MMFLILIILKELYHGSIIIDKDENIISSLVYVNEFYRDGDKPQPRIFISFKGDIQYQFRCLLSEEG